VSSDEPNPPAGAPPPDETQRQAPTIELTANQVGRERESVEPGSSEPAHASSEGAAAAGAARKAGRGSILSLLGVGLLGGLIAAAVMVIASFFIAPSDTATALAARMSHLEQEVRELAARPGTAGLDAKTIDDLRNRIATLETRTGELIGMNSKVMTLISSLSTMPYASSSEVSMLEGNVKALSENIGAAQRRTDEATALAREARESANAAAAGLDAMAQRLGNVEQELAKRSATQSNDRPARLLIAATALRGAVDRGESFTAELGAARAVGADTHLVAALEPFAASGVPSTVALARELSALTPALFAAAAGSAREGNFLQKLQANAERLVRVHRVDETPGNDVAAILARIATDADRADVSAALTELPKLPPEVRAPAEQWMKKAQARGAAVAAARALTAEGLAGLSK
jgi:hypothetical protein